MHVYSCMYLFSTNPPIEIRGAVKTCPSSWSDPLSASPSIVLSCPCFSLTKWEFALIRDPIYFGALDSERSTFDS